MSQPETPHGPAPVVAPFQVDDVPWEEWSRGVRFGGRVRKIGARAGGSKVGVILEELPPHRQSAPFHWHTREEEHLWFLSGHATLRLGEERYPLAAGDYVCFPASRALGHCLINEGDEPCRYLVIGERSPDDVCVYPDSGKLLIVNAGGLILSTGNEREYWDGEDADRSPV